VRVDLPRLTEQELLVLVGLVKLVVHADREVSPAERAVLGRVQEVVGAVAWNTAVRTARERYVAIDVLEADARAVERREVRHAIHDLLVELAGSDEIIDAEAHVLQWVVQEWGLHEPTEEAAPVDEFVMMDEDE
jgi:hypothetical protein